MVIWHWTYGKGPFNSKRGNLLPQLQGLLFLISSKGSFICTIPQDKHTMAFVTPVVEHWLEREIVQCVHHDRLIHGATFRCCFVLMSVMNLVRSLNLTYSYYWKGALFTGQSTIMFQFNCLHCLHYQQLYKLNGTKINFSYLSVHNGLQLTAIITKHPSPPPPPEKINLIKKTYKKTKHHKTKQKQ